MKCGLIVILQCFIFFPLRLHHISFLQMFDDTALIPSVPYYELPAGMMMPLIEMEDVLVTYLVPVFVVILFELV